MDSHSDDHFFDFLPKYVILSEPCSHAVVIMKYALNSLIVVTRDVYRVVDSHVYVYVYELYCCI